ncbi:hypothetical protein Y032_0082g1517 [Ancylostoma ceylanicum]|uniref:Uncharacterized protein n=1 Tax=Ancylostoma ceylanicum TaxID=53326 RepID=A0A016TRP4_9BILA|nr:hypothetical protein Y032_0082g1517 [Ancylostoma ceylanicum]
MYSVINGVLYSVVYGIRTIHRDSWLYPRIPVAENSSTLWTPGKQRFPSPSFGVFHAVSSPPVSSSFLKTLFASGIFNTEIPVNAAFKTIAK